MSYIDLDNSLEKEAYISSNGNDTTLEKSVSDMAHSYMQEKAPSLLKNETGFQIVERSDDDSKIMAIIAYKANGLQLYSPIFYIRGEIKGEDLLYVADTDTFIPMKEAWVNEILQRKPITLGDPIQKSTRGMISPNLEIFAIPPSKTASFKLYDPEIEPGVRAFARLRGRDITKTAAACRDLRKNLESLLDFNDYVKLAGKSCASKFVDYLDKYPIIKRAFNSRYKGLEDSLRKQASDLSIDSILSGINKEASVKEAKAVRIISMSFSMTRGGIPFDLSDLDKEKFLRDGYLVEDNREDEDVSTVINNEEDFSSSENPTKTGVYDVLMSPHRITKCVVLFPNSNSKAYGPNKEVILMSFDGNKSRMCAAKDIWCVKQYPFSEYLKWFNKQGIAAQKLAAGKRVVFLTDTGGVYGDYTVDGKDGEDCWDAWGGINKICVNKIKGTAIIKEENKIIVPTTTKTVVLDNDIWDSEFKPYDLLSSRCDMFCPVTPKTYKEACYVGSEGVKLTVKDGECSINNAPYTTAFSGFKSLIEDFGLREGTAKDFMKKAERSLNHTLRFFIKRALNDPSRVKDESITPSIPSIMDTSPNPLGFQGDMAPNGVAESRIQSPDNRDVYAYHPDSAYPADDARNVEQAIENGQKEVFDVSMLKSLLTNADTETQIDKLVVKMTKAMNTVGKLLFLYYWKGDEFENLYGPQKLTEFEGSARKAFEVLGDMILFLKRNKLETANFEGSEPIKLSDNED